MMPYPWRSSLASAIRMCRVAGESGRNRLMVSIFGLRYIGFRMSCQIGFVRTAPGNSASVKREWLLRLSENSSDETRGVGVRPIGVCHFKFRGDLSPSLIDRYALAFEGECQGSNLDN